MGSTARLTSSLRYAPAARTSSLPSVGRLSAPRTTGTASFYNPRVPNLVRRASKNSSPTSRRRSRRSSSRRGATSTRHPELAYEEMRTGAGRRGPARGARSDAAARDRPDRRLRGRGAGGPAAAAARRHGRPAHRRGVGRAVRLAEPGAHARLRARRPRRDRPRRRRAPRAAAARARAALSLPARRGGRRRRGLLRSRRRARRGRGGARAAPLEPDAGRKDRDQSRRPDGGGRPVLDRGRGPRRSRRDAPRGRRPDPRRGAHRRVPAVGRLAGDLASRFRGRDDRVDPRRHRLQRHPLERDRSPARPAPSRRRRVARFPRRSAASSPAPPPRAGSRRP